MLLLLENIYLKVSLVAQLVKELACNVGDLIYSWVGKFPRRKGIGTHSSILMTSLGNVAGKESSEIRKPGTASGLGSPGGREDNPRSVL